MYEFELHEVLQNNPSLIEDGLIFLDREVNVGSGLRCDLLFQDKAGKKVYVEVKWAAGKRAAIQIEQYEVLVNKAKESDSRFVLTAIDARPGMEEIINRRGFEFIKISLEKLIELKPEWKEKLLLKSARNSVKRKAATESITGKNPRLLVLKKIYETVKDELPGIYINRGKKSRLLINWAGNDYFNFFFSNAISDGFRCAFVLDLDKKDSSRRDAFKEILVQSKEKVEELYSELVLDMADKRIVHETSHKSWIKIMRHRWYSIYIMHRLGEINWHKPDETAEKIVPLIFSFIEKTDSLLQVFRPPVS